MRCESRCVAAPPTARGVTRILGVAELVGTASAAIAAVFAAAAAAGELPAGVVVDRRRGPRHVGLLRRVEAAGVRLQEFTGVPQPS